MVKDSHSSLTICEEHKGIEFSVVVFFQALFWEWNFPDDNFQAQ